MWSMVQVTRRQCWIKMFKERYINWSTLKKARRMGLAALEKVFTKKYTKYWEGDTTLYRDGRSFVYVSRQKSTTGVPNTRKIKKKQNFNFMFAGTLVSILVFSLPKVYKDVLKSARRFKYPEIFDSKPYVCMVSFCYQPVMNIAVC